MQRSTVGKRGSALIGKIIELCRTGKNSHEIAALVGLSAGHVRRVAAKNGFVLPRPPRNNRGSFRHGHCPYRKPRSSEYSSWVGMKSRCRNTNSKKYQYYGGRGILFDPRWTEFENFLADMGLKPSPAHTLERKNVNKNYEKGNCVWAPPGPTQSRNRRYTKLTLITANLLRTMYASGLFTQKELALEFDISEGHVPSILNGKYWANP